MKRGEIWWTDAGEPSGSEPGFRRPAVIVSANEFNATTIRTVVVVFLTANAARALDPGNIWLTSRQTGLPSGSTLNVTQLTTVDKRLLTDRVSRLSETVMRQIDDGLRLVLSL
jgi:mRNA interferase MazF